MPNAFDHRIFAGDSWSDMGAAVAAALLGATNTNGLDAAYPTGLTYAYGAGAGTTPTAFTTQTQFSAGSNALRGTINFNTGSSTAAGLLLTVTFPVALTIANLTGNVYVFVSWNVGSVANSSAATLSAQGVVSSSKVTGFILNAGAAVTASQGSATAAAYAVNYLVLG
jgi:hypothetical protein